ncbi:MAG: hypothetical protein M1829_006677 [Trizodia sp. TS-e1964]|nr:MAG: hypothetical protein M1829_006677 [Trizodia sp. TS-e1964]
MWNSDGSRRYSSAQHAPETGAGVSHFDWAPPPRPPPPVSRLLQGISSQFSPRTGSLAGLDAWARESVTSFKSNASRRSSVISTQTRTSVTTAQDEPRSGIELTHEDGRRYRISFDGQITILGDSPAHDQNVLSPGSNYNTVTPTAIDIPIALLADDDVSSPDETRQTQPESAMVSRTPSFTPGKDQLSVRHVSSGSMTTGSTLQVDNSEAKGKPLHRSKAIKLPRIQTRPAGQGRGPQSPNSAASYVSTASHSSLSPSAQINKAPQSPSGPYMGRKATGIFPSNANISGTASKAERPQNHATAVLNQNSSNGNQELEDIPSPGSKRPFNSHFETQRDGINGDSSPPVFEGAEDASLLFSTVCDSPTHIDEDPIGSRSPPMNDVNDVSIHFTRLVRTLDSNHQKELLAKNQEIEQTKKMFLGLTQEISNLKTELIRTTSHMRSVSEPSAETPPDLPAQNEGKVFFFPPLNLNNVKTLKAALVRRAEKLRSNHDSHEIGALITSSHQVLEDASLVQSRNASVDHSYLPSIEAIQSPNAGAVGQLRKALDASKTQSAVLKAEVTSLQAAVNRLRDSVSFWTDRYEAVERQRSELDKSLKTMTYDMEVMYRRKYQDREQKLLDRITLLETSQSQSPPPGITIESE